MYFTPNHATHETYDHAKNEKLLYEYERLAKLDNAMTPQSRGKRFDYFLAELLDAFGIRAQASKRSNGEIDVAFEVNNSRFILEAKWEKKKTDTGRIAKLQKRVRQRLAGTIGVFLSMSGYTPEALEDIKDGEKLEVVLLDRNHFEAMLTGFFDAAELLDYVLDAAHFSGLAYVPLSKLLAQSRPKVSNREWLPTQYEPLRMLEWSGNKLEMCPQQLNQRPTELRDDFPHWGVEERWALDGQLRFVSTREKGIYVARNRGLVAISEEEFRPVAGALNPYWNAKATEKYNVVAPANVETDLDRVWTWTRNAACFRIVETGDRVGEQTERTIKVPANDWVYEASEVAVGARTVVYKNESHLTIVDAGNTHDILLSDQIIQTAPWVPWGKSIRFVSKHEIVVASRAGHTIIVWLVDLRSNNVSELGRGSFDSTDRIGCSLDVGVSGSVYLSVFGAEHRELVGREHPEITNASTYCLHRSGVEVDHSKG